MRPIFALPLVLAISSCQPSKQESTSKTAPAATVVETPATPVPHADLRNSVVRINSTQQAWDFGQPWEKDSPRHRRALAAIVGPQQVLTTSEMVADATYLEFESTDGTHFAQAKIIAVDYEANLALLGPVSDTEGKVMFEKASPLELTTPPKIGQALDIVQVEENNLPLLTPGTLQSVDVTSNFLAGNSFLTYMVKASMQGAASSYSLPVLQNGKLAGVLISYNDKDQICDVASTDIVTRFLKEAAGGDYKGFPSLGISIARTDDASFREWLKLPEDRGGLFIHSVRKGRAADLAGLKPGDVLMALDGHEIDRRGYYQHSNYGSVYWGHLVRGEKLTGDVIRLSIFRDGQPMEMQATLTREEESSKLVPGYLFGKEPNYLVKGGFIFQELSRPLMEAYGEDWTKRAPLDFLDALENPEKYEDKVDRIVFLSGSIPTPATVGYEKLRNLIVSKVNGKEIKNMRDLIEAFKGNLNELHSIEFAEEKFTVYLDDQISTAVDAQLLKRGITRLSRSN